MMRKETVDLIVAAIQVLTLIAIIIYVWKTWQLASDTRAMSEAAKKSAEATLKSAELSEKVLQEMEASRDLLVTPHVIVYFDNQYENFGRLFLVVRNVGKGLAENIKLKFTPDLINHDGPEIGKIFMLKHGIPSLPPGYEIRHSFDRIGAYFDGDGTYRDNGLPKAYDVEVTFYGGIDKEKPKTVHQKLDLEVFIGTHTVKVKRVLDTEDE
jgi:hypothetical protein